MALQSQVYTSYAVAVPGDKATPDQSIYTSFNFLVGEDAGINVGQFVFRDAATQGVAMATSGTAQTLLGFVERVINYPNYNVASEGTLTVPKGYALTIAVRGDYYVAAPATVAIGDAVTVDETGAIVSGGAINTGWSYKTAGDAGDIVIISNWTPPVSASDGASSNSYMLTDFSNAEGALGWEHGGTSNTTQEGLKTDMENLLDISQYAKTEDLAGYATTASVNSALADYAKTEDLGELATKDQVDLTSDVTGTLPTTSGGTGNTTGNAATATRLATARTITLEGTANGSASFDGSANITITTTGE